MTNEQIFKKLIQKAHKNGWKCGLEDWATWKTLDLSKKAEIVFQKNLLDIFSHSFAKAFWGKQRVCEYCLRYINMNSDEICERHSDYEAEKWKAGLQNMVLEKEHLKYIKQFT